MMNMHKALILDINIKLSGGKRAGVPWRNQELPDMVPYHDFYLQKNWKKSLNWWSVPCWLVPSQADKMMSFSFVETQTLDAEAK
jgi:hypothetical protein